MYDKCEISRCKVLKITWTPNSKSWILHFYLHGAPTSHGEAYFVNKLNKIKFEHEEINVYSRINDVFSAM